MSHRALQRLRQERQPEILPSIGDDDDSDYDDDDDDEEDQHEPKKTNVFGAAMFNDDSSDDDSVEDSVDDLNPKNDVCITFSVKEEHIPFDFDVDDKDEPDVENLDELIKEYKIQDETQEENIATIDSSFYYGVIMSGIEVRDLDIDFVMRTSLLGGSTESSSSGSSSRRTLFGTPRDNWPRPPHYVGGGIGMRSCEEISSSSSGHVLPWPYCDMKEKDLRCPSPQNWSEFIYSDSYQRDYRDLETIIASGDPNNLALFVAHHPFVVEALLQLSTVMYHMNQSQEGLSLLKRSLWVFDNIVPKSFMDVKNRSAFMDYQKHGNKQFFATLFRLIRVSYVAGLTRTSLAASQLVLSLDPLRDPMNVLLSIDHFALMCNTDSCSTWLVDFVESKRVSLNHTCIKVLSRCLLSLLLLLFNFH
jgi:hypothetical protein